MYDIAVTTEYGIAAAETNHSFPATAESVTFMIKQNEAGHQHTAGKCCRSGYKCQEHRNVPGWEMNRHSLNAVWRNTEQRIITVTRFSK